MQIDHVVIRLTDKYNSTGNADAFEIIDDVTGSTNFRIKRNGYVWSRRVEVTMNNFPDYVFKTDYVLPSLYELEEFIKKNGHLPNMPSAEAVEKQGADLGEITRVNVEKSEELFLYLIEMKKEIDNLKKENADLKKKVDQIESQAQK